MKFKKRHRMKVNQARNTIVNVIIFVFGIFAFSFAGHAMEPESSPAKPKRTTFSIPLGIMDITLPVKEETATLLHKFLDTHPIAGELTTTLRSLGKEIGVLAVSCWFDLTPITYLAGAFLCKDALIFAKDCWVIREYLKNTKAAAAAVKKE